MLQNLLDASPAEKVGYAVEALTEFANGLHAKGLDESEIKKQIEDVTKLFVSADLDCVGDEYSFYKAVTGFELSPEEFYDVTNGGRDPNFMKECFGFLSTLDQRTKVAACLYGFSVLSCDDKITADECKLVDIILG